jgi:hypothetical protein
LYAEKKSAKTRTFDRVLVGGIQSLIVKAPQLQGGQGAAARRSSLQTDYLTLDKAPPYLVPQASRFTLEKYYMQSLTLVFGSHSFLYAP